MNLRLLGRLAAACLAVSASFTAATAQTRTVVTHRVGYPAPRTTYTPTRSAPGVQLGIRAGLNVADWSGDAVQSLQDLAELTQGNVVREMKPGFHAGLYATLPLGDKFSVEPGLSYSEKGTRLVGTLPFEQFDFLNAKVTATARMAYLDIPLNFKAHLTPGLYLYGGPQASVLLSNKARVEASALGFDAWQQDFDIKNQFRAVDFAVTGGLGYQFDSGFGLRAGYDYGLSSLDKNNRFDAQNRVIKAALNYAF